MTDRNERARARRRQARIDEAALELLAGMRAIERFADVAARDGVTLDDTGVDLPRVRRRIIAAAERIELYEVHGELDDSDAGRLLGGKDDGR